MIPKLRRIPHSRYQDDTTISTYLPFGVTNGPGVFQRLMSMVLDGLLGIYALNYIDDILITGKTFDEICLNMNIVFDRLEQAKLNGRL